MNTRLINFFEENRILNKCQIGFRNRHRNSRSYISLKTLIDCYRLKRKPIFACFIDFKKAYDSVYGGKVFFISLFYLDAVKRFYV